MDGHEVGGCRETAGVVDGLPDGGVDFDIDNRIVECYSTVESIRGEGYY